jgi:FkbM family methyltransferase
MLKRALSLMLPMPVRKILAYAIRPAAIAYVQTAPWSYGKLSIYELYDRYISWLPYQTTVCTRFGGRMRISLPDLISRTIYLTGRWEPVITEYVRSALKEGDTFVDVGANIGYYSLVASRIVCSSGKVFAVEASPSNYERMRQNLSLNGATNIRPINAAASDSRGELTLFLGPPDNRGHSTTVMSLADREGLQPEATVPADTLEELVGKQDLRNARLIKIDVEGAERAVLAPLFTSLEKFSPETEWLLELAPVYSASGQGDVDEIFDAFTSRGYYAYSIPNKYEHQFFLSNGTDDSKLTPLPAAPRDALTDVLMTRLPRAH